MALQERIMDGTLKAVSTFKPVKIATNALFYAVFVGLFYYLLVGSIDWVGVLVCVVGGILYSLFRDVFTHRSFKAGLAAHLAFMREKHPAMELYVPLVEKLGGSLLLKRAGLFLEDGVLALEAFNQPAFAKTPKDSITVPRGVDFKIYDAFEEAKLPLVGFRSELMQNAYRFHVVKDDEAVARISAFAEPPAPADAAPAEPERKE